ncbi:MAG: hypothetical protein DRJ34_02585 [Thermoprotei archaeon]|nr:MAG: hypothetical protein DRJ34_02585 [Thermoprotei archaeon]RLE72016.1 MAG: hypothetical protein DRJ45_02590 [Thermoprotei archaeon]
MNDRGQFYTISLIIFMSILLMMIVSYPIFNTYIVEENSFTRAQIIESIFLECIAYSSQRKIMYGGSIQRYVHKYVGEINKHLLNLSKFYRLNINISDIVFEGGLDEKYYKIYLAENPQLYYMVSWNYSPGNPDKYFTINFAGEAEYKYNFTLEYRHYSSLINIVQPNITIYTLSMYRIENIVVRRIGLYKYIIAWPVQYDRIIILDSYGVMILIDVNKNG